MQGSSALALLLSLCPRPLKPHRPLFHSLHQDFDAHTPQHSLHSPRRPENESVVLGVAAAAAATPAASLLLPPLLPLPVPLSLLLPRRTYARLLRLMHMTRHAGWRRRTRRGFRELQARLPQAPRAQNAAGLMACAPASTTTPHHFLCLSACLSVPGSVLTVLQVCHVCLFLPPSLLFPPVPLFPSPPLPLWLLQVQLQGVVTTSQRQVTKSQRLPHAILRASLHLPSLQHRQLLLFARPAQA